MFESWITGVCSPYVVSLCDFACVRVRVCSCYVMLVCHQYDVCIHYVGSVYVGGYGGLSESGLCVFLELCTVGFLVVVVSPSVLL